MDTLQRAVVDSFGKQPKWKKKEIPPNQKTTDWFMKGVNNLGSTSNLACLEGVYKNVLPHVCFSLDVLLSVSQSFSGVTQHFSQNRPEYNQM